jgi:polysaccharide biosynthesis/export protein
MKNIAMRSMTTFLAMTLLLGVGLAGQGEKESQEKPRAASPSVDANYIIGPNDVLDINVWKEPDISRRVPVRPDGKISLPLLNDVTAAGLTPMELQATVTDGLKKFISDPQITVIVVEVNSRRVFVLGEISHPGPLGMLPNMTVLQALSAAGGFSQFAKLNGIYVMRVRNGQQKTFPFNYKDVIRGKNPEQNIILEPGDTIVVP